jgi:hypothetical protein
LGFAYEGDEDEGEGGEGEGEGDVEEDRAGVGRDLQEPGSCARSGRRAHGL